MSFLQRRTSDYSGEMLISQAQTSTLGSPSEATLMIDDKNRRHLDLFVFCVLVSAWITNTCVQEFGSFSLPLLTC